jgi:hypothetical protein
MSAARNFEVDMEDQDEQSIKMVTSSPLTDTFEIEVHSVEHGVLMIIGNYGCRSWISISNQDAKKLAYNLMLVAK